MSAPQWSFAHFRIDPTNARLWQGTEPLVVPPKAFDVLAYLVTHPECLVTKDELLDAVWGQTAVSDAVVRVAVGTLRKALGDTGQPPRMIATVPRRGYRFLAPVTLVRAPTAPSLPCPPSSVTSPPLLVAREEVFQRLGEAWAQVCQGQRQVIGITGEAGIGKTAVVEAFLAQIRTEAQVWVAVGQCVEHYGTGEAYLPVLEALEQLCRGPGGARLVALLHQQAPTWLVQLPWLLRVAPRAQLHAELQGTTRERMLREGAELVDTLTADTPLALVFEDLHWSDYATVDLLALLARRRTPARLLVIGTYRPAEVLLHHPPLRRVLPDLQRQGVAWEIPLSGLCPAAVAAYLTARFPCHHFPPTLAAWLHHRTAGNPLFLVTVVQMFVERGVLQLHDEGWTMPGGLAACLSAVPDTLRQLLEQLLTRLPPEAQRVLMVASVAGMEFTAATVAAGLAVDPAVVEEHCDALVQQQILRALGVTQGPAGSVVSRYAFHHALYQEGLYQRLGEGQRVRLHRRLGTWLEAAYGTTTGESAAVLAAHFVRGQDPARALPYLQRAAEQATQRYAPHEVTSLLTQALTLLRELPATLARTQQELAVHMLLGPAVMAIKGHAVPEVQAIYTRAQALCHQVPEHPHLPQVLAGLWLFQTGHGRHQRAQATGRHLLRVARHLADPGLLLQARGSLGITALYLGNVRAARRHLEQGIVLSEGLGCRSLPLQALFDIGVVCRIGAAWALQQLGYADQARARGSEALAVSATHASPYNRSNVLLFQALFHLFSREESLALQRVEEALGLATTRDFLLLAALSTLVRGATLTAQAHVEEGLQQIRQGLSACQTLGAQQLQPWGLAMLAESYGRLGQPAVGLRVLGETHEVMVTTQDTFYAAEIARLQGELHLDASRLAVQRGQETALAEAERCLQHAVQVARRQYTRWWELRAAVSLARLWQQQGKRADARALLAPIYGWFTEGFDTPDLREAKTLLEELRG